MRALKFHTIAPYIDHLVGEVRNQFPERFDSMTEHGVRGFIARVIETGRLHRVDTSSAMPTLVELMLTFGEEFELSPDKDWALAVLSHQSLPAQVKVEVMRKRMMGRPALLR